MRYSLRSLRQSPAFCVIVVLMLAAGLGSNLLIFSFVDALLLRPLPVPHPDQLVHFMLLRSANIPQTEFVYIHCRTLQQRAQSFQSVFASGDDDVTLASGGRTLRLFAQQVSGNFAEALGIVPALGKPFTEADAAAGRYPAMLSYSFWRHEFGGRTDIIGQTIQLRDTPFTVAAVLPREFRGMDLDTAPDVYIPYWSHRRWGASTVLAVPVHIYGRLRTGVSIDRARAEFTQLYPAMIEAEIAMSAASDPKAAHDIRAATEAHRPWLEDAGSGRSGVRTQFSLAVRILFGAVAFLLLLVCANVGGLMLARSEARRQEIAIRLSLGASRFRVMGVALWDCVLLLAAGLAGAIIIAAWGVPALLRMLPARRPLAVDPHLDWRLLLFATGLCAAAALLMSLVPVLHVMRTDLTGMMGRGGSRVRRSRTSRVFMTVQITLATALTIGGVTLAQSLDRLRHADPGLVPDRIIVAEFNPRTGFVRKPGEQVALVDALLQRTRELPGVQDVSLALIALMRGVGFKTTVAPAGRQATAKDFLNASMHMVSPNHLTNLEMRLVAGRSLSPADATAPKPKPVVVTRSFASRFFPGVEPLGQSFGTGINAVAGADYQIVGVAADAKYRSMREEAPPTFFQIASREDTDLFDDVTFYVRVYDDPARVMPAVRGMLSRAGVPPMSLATLPQEMESTLWRERILAAFASCFAVLAALLSGAGLYGMLAHSIRRRTREIGIRVALGATVQRVASLVGRDVAACLLPGLLLGVAVYALCSRYLAPLLYGVRALDVPLLASGAAFIAAVALIAGLIPARRAMRIHPAEALRDQ